MATFLSDEWLEDCRATFARLPTVPGASARLEHLVTGTPAGDVRLALVVDEGRLTEARRGDQGDADLTVTTTHADALLLAAGALDPSVAVMQGRAKVAGDIGRLLAVLPVTRTAAFRTALAALHGRTTTD
jgi:predicted lipid carrier protein YhbT